MFPSWTNGLRPALAVGGVGALGYLLFLVAYGASPKTTDVGYQPRQPLPYSHATHAGKLGIDCRYCHNTVERAPRAAVPPTQTCMNCHANIRLKEGQRQKLLQVEQSAASGLPIAWVRVHDLPDFVYFDHSAHVRRGVGCVTCHGRVDKMEVVYQAAPLSMGWCLDCHRDPKPYLRPLERITDMQWQPIEDRQVLAARLARAYNVKPATDCSTCHR